MTESPSGTKPLALVTGASQGIGFELAKQFAEHGYDLVVVADSPKIGEAARMLRSTGVQVQDVQIDLATPEGVEQFHQTIRSTGRPVDAVALNAGVGAGG